MMTAWEKDFMRGIDGRRTLTPKQMEVVESVNAGSWRASRNSAKGNGQQTREDRTMAFTSSRPKLDLAAIRASNPLPAVVGASVKLLRAGNEWKACCPLHADRSPSFTIFDGGVRFHCFGCGASGDVLDYLQQLHGVSLPEAAAMLQGGAIPTVPVRALPVEPERDTTADAVSIWRSAVPATETPAEAYLRGRGLHLPIPPTVRFSRLRYGGRDGLHPCLVALLTSGDDKPVGIQRTFLTEQGRKADVPTVKLSLGRIRGAAIRLAPAAAELVVTGRLEDGLTLQQELGRPVWSSPAKATWLRCGCRILFGQSRLVLTTMKAVKAMRVGLLPLSLSKAERRGLSALSLASF
jgi:DNA primase